MTAQIGIRSNTYYIGQPVLLYSKEPGIVVESETGDYPFDV